MHFYFGTWEANGFFPSNFISVHTPADSLIYSQCKDGITIYLGSEINESILYDILYGILQKILVFNSVRLSNKLFTSH